jgi:hypothetical protein
MTLRVTQVRSGSRAPSTTAGSTPARHTDDLPTPESPATTTKGWLRRRSRRVWISLLRPKKRSRC